MGPRYLFGRFALMIFVLLMVFILNVNQGMADYDTSLLKEKGLNQEWIDSLFEPGEQKIYRGKELFTIGMPCGGVCAGQLYVRGDGTLAGWWIFNNPYNSEDQGIIQTALGPYERGYPTHRPTSLIENSFAVRVKAKGESAIVRELDQTGFDAIEFIGEYPIATIRYADKANPLPVNITAQVYSPFIPLDTHHSSMPVTVLEYTVENPGEKLIEVSVAGRLQNPVCLQLKDLIALKSRNQIIRENGLVGVFFDTVADESVQMGPRRTKVIEDFEDGTLDRWKIESTNGVIPELSTKWAEFSRSGDGWVGKYFFSNSAMAGRTGKHFKGKMTSRAFKITEPYIAFKLGGYRMRKNIPKVKLEVDGKIVRDAMTSCQQQFVLEYWDVKEFMGKSARMIVEITSELHLNLDHIYLTNIKPDYLLELPQDHRYKGNMALTALDSSATASAGWDSREAFLADLKSDGRLNEVAQLKYNLGELSCGGVGQSVTLAPGEKKTVSFLLSWYFPNRHQTAYKAWQGSFAGYGPLVGNMYGNYFDSALDVAQYVKRNYDELRADTFLFHDTYFDSTMPYWFTHRIDMPISTFATETCQWWGNGRFWAWEGVGCCEGTCTHVWNYSQALARLFPELERSVREKQDLGAGFDADTGRVRYRGEGCARWATDGQGGTVVKAYRDHLMSRDEAYLRRNWQSIKKVLLFLISKDFKQNGLIGDNNHCTYDRELMGINTMTGSCYLAALRAAEIMAERVGDKDFALRCRELLESGSAHSIHLMWDGEYFYQRLLPEDYPSNIHRAQYGRGCLSDQLLGQSLAHQVGLGYLYPKKNVDSALRSVFRYNWFPVLTAYYDQNKRGRNFAEPNEAGLVIVTWPKGKKVQGKFINEVWSGIEYQVASHMLYEGLIPEGLAILRGIHERYDGLRHNPWNEPEAGEHYARALASWGCLISVSGFTYDGPAGVLGFAPRMQADNFKAFFTAAEGWGSLSQQRSSKTQTNSVMVKWGKINLNKLQFELPTDSKVEDVSISLSDAQKEYDADFSQTGNLIDIKLKDELTVKRDQDLVTVMRW